MAIIVVLVVAGVLGYREFYNWQQRRLVAQADALVDRGDYKNASLDARRLLQIHPESADGCRIMARISERVGLRSALDWRRRMVELNSPKPSDFIALGRAAVRFGDWQSVSFALSRIGDPDKQSADYHVLLADVAAARHDGNETARQLEEAVRLEPTRKDSILRLAILRLSASDAKIRDAGLQTLRALRSEPSLRREAIRSLVEDAIREKRPDTALEFARTLDALPERNFSDQLLFLTALQAAGDANLADGLHERQRQALQNSEETAAMVTWMNAHGLAHDAISWSEAIPLNLRANILVAVALSDSYMAMRDWTGILRFVQGGSWGQIDFLRNALAARAQRESGNESAAQAQWREALKKINGAPKQALLLADTVERWGWDAERTDLLWLAAKDPERGDDALKTLYARFAQDGATQDLYRVCLHRQEFHPADRNIQNNVAQLSLLLDMNADRARKVARDLYLGDPKNAAYASTYAFALHSSGDSKNAVKTMSGLTDAQLRQPQIAAYYGIILATAGDAERALQFLDLGASAKLLPEEKALLEKARRQIAQN